MELPLTRAPIELGPGQVKAVQRVVKRMPCGQAVFTRGWMSRSTCVPSAR